MFLLLTVLPALAADFNLDGYDDLVVGAPWESVGSVYEAGYLHLLRGSSSGIASAGQAAWDQSAFAETNSQEDHFADVLATGDFDGNGWPDLIVGVPDEDLTGGWGGIVQVMYGSAGGLRGSSAVSWSQDAAGILDGVENADEFGASLAVGDFNGDACDDLAIGVPGESVPGYDNAGMVAVLYGSPVAYDDMMRRISAGGLTSDDDQIWYPGYDGMEGEPEEDGNLGAVLAAGDIDGDGLDDLAIGAPGSGTLHMLYGTAVGLADLGDPVLRQEAWALAIGDFDDDGYADVAAGAPLDTVDGLIYAGAVDVLFGTSAGLSSAGSVRLTQGSGGLSGTLEAFDYTGFSLASGDANGDDVADLVVGVPQEDIGTITDAGSVHIAYGSSSGFQNGQAWYQDVANVAETSEEDDWFGWSATFGDYDADGFDDLAVGVPGEQVGIYDGAGAVHVFYGSAAGVATSRDVTFNQDSTGISGVADGYDAFGMTMR